MRRWPRRSGPRSTSCSRADVVAILPHLPAHGKLPFVSSHIAVLASGAGSNLGAILAHLAAHASRDRQDTEGRDRHEPEEGARSGDGVRRRERLADRGAGPATAAPGTVALVASNRRDAGALRIAREAGIATAVIDQPADGAAWLSLLSAHRIDLVALAGYLKRVPDVVTRAFRGRVLNVHPALLPAFGGAGMYGLRVHAAVLEAGVALSGATVHFVDEQFDHGPIIAQWPVPVLADDRPEALAARVLRVEHALYPCVVAAVAAGRIHLDADGRVRGRWPHAAPGTHFTLTTEEAPPPCP